MNSPIMALRWFCGVVSFLALGKATINAQEMSQLEAPAAGRTSVIDLRSFPGPDNTGVPKGTILTPYDGPCEISEPNTLIDARIVSCDLFVLAPGLRITRSITKRIDVDTPGATLVIEDSKVAAGQWQNAAIGFAEITMRRVEISGGQSSVLCSNNCLIEDSWLHGQYLRPDQPQHLGGFLSNGGHDVTLRHNTIGCEPPDNGVGGGCTGDAQILGDFSKLTRFRFERNLFLATPGGFCTSFGYNPGKPFGNDPTFITVIDNIYVRGPSGKCAVYGPTTSFDAAGEGNVWQGNIWDDGSPLGP